MKRSTTSTCCMCKDPSSHKVWHEKSGRNVQGQNQHRTSIRSPVSQMQNSPLNQINKSLMRNFHPHSCVVSELIFLLYQAMLLDKYARCTELVNYSWIISYRNANCQNFELSLIAEKYDKHYYTLVHQLHHIRVQG